MGREEYARAGLIGYGASREAPYRHASGMVDKLRRGVKPADLTVDEPATRAPLRSLASPSQRRCGCAPVP